MSIGFPVVFLSVAAFMINAVLSRLLNLQREQIAIMKAFGFTNRQIAVHYLKFALVIVAVGTALGGCGGMVLGHRLVVLYHKFFRFPDLAFHADPTAFPLALLVCTVAAVIGVFGAVRRAARVPPAEAMRPEPPANYRPAFVERTGIAHLLSHTFRIAVRNLERRPVQALFTVAGLALATGILVVPNAFRDSVAQILETQWDSIQRSDLSIGLVEPNDTRVQHLLRQLPGVITVEPARGVAARISFGHQRRQLGIQGIPADSRGNLPGYEWLRSYLTDPASLAKVDKLLAVAADLDVPLSQLALAWCVKNPHVSTVITGASSVQQVRENMTALDALELLSDDVMARIDAALAA